MYTKRRCACMFAVLLVIACGVSTAYAARPIYARLVMPIFFESEIPKDIDMIQEAVNRITEEKIGATVVLVPLLYMYERADPLRLAELEMLAKQGVYLDIYPTVVPNMTAIELDDLLEQYGQEIKALIGEFRLSFAASNGPLRSLDQMNDYVSSVGITMRKDIIDKYEIDVSEIVSIADLDVLFSFLSTQEPDMKMVSPFQTRSTLLSRTKQRQLIPNSILDVSESDSTALVNYYATDTYRESVEMIRRWYLAGYLPDNMALQNIMASQLVGADGLFSYITAYRPGVEYEETRSSGIPMITVALDEPIVSRHSIRTTKWCISSTCVNPGKAMQFLSLLYTDSDLVNLMIYGLEGTHYALVDDGTIDYPEGISADTVGYSNTLSSLLPNQTIAYVWQGNDPQLWEKLREHNESAAVSDALTFDFDESSVRSAYTSVNAIINKYAYGLETGQIDPVIYLPLMLEEMTAAGAEQVLEEAQRQFDNYIAERSAKK